MSMMDNLFHRVQTRRPPPPGVRTNAIQYPGMIVCDCGVLLGYMANEAQCYVCVQKPKEALEKHAKRLKCWPDED